MSRPVCENQGTGLRVGLLPARPGEEDETADKRVESFRVPCLDAGSTPATSTNETGIFLNRRGMPVFVLRAVCLNSGFSRNEAADREKMLSLRCES